ncbi:sialate O-acetylesterase [Poriferisphaera sp. WC338]|uniref:sialate O-acetylesterase n=1 Tax=Poriferisphaera sp. WC338 TaxID=3425129 RepID=UPI003D817610
MGLRQSRVFFLVLSVLFLTCGEIVIAEGLRLPAMISDHAVMQADKPIAIWGWGEAGKKVSVKLGDQVGETVVGDDGKWQLKLGVMKAGGPYRLEVSSAGESIWVKDVLIGEVWLCGGQSNMEWRLHESEGGKEAIKNSADGEMRYFLVTKRVSRKPVEEVEGEWKVISPETAGGISGVGYYFGKELREHVGEPVGLVNSNWGGTRVEAWTSEESLKANVAGQQILKANASWEALSEAKLEQYTKAIAEYEVKRINAEPTDRRPWVPLELQRRHYGSNLYNGMIHGVSQYTMRGAIWYQGESNAGRAEQYIELFPLLIEDWREQWGQDAFAFGFVQLANYYEKQKEPVQAATWPELREAQLLTLKRVPDTGMAVITDIGEAKDIHPRNKKDVGIRLSLWARATQYGEKELVYSGPIYADHAIEGDQIRIKFDHVGDGLMASDGSELRGFAIAGEDKKFVWAEAVIQGKSVVVSAAGVKKPVSVRYNWANNPVGNLVNKNGLQASLFRTDDWPRVTRGKWK